MSGNEDRSGGSLAAGIGACVVFIATLALACFICGIRPLHGMIVQSDDGQIDYCYITSHTFSVPMQAKLVIYNLVGHVPHRADRLLGQNYTIEQAREGAKTYGCELR